MIRLTHVFLLILTLSIFIIRSIRSLPFAETTDVNGFNFDPLFKNEFNEPGPESEDVQSYFDENSNPSESPEIPVANPSEFNPVEFKPHLNRLVETSDMFGFSGEGHKKYKVLMLFKEKGISYIFKVIVFPSNKGEPKIYDVYVNPLHSKCQGKYYKIVVVPRHKPEAWKEIKLCIPYPH